MIEGGISERRDRLGTQPVGSFGWHVVIKEEWPAIRSLKGLRAVGEHGVAWRWVRAMERGRAKII